MKESDQEDEPSTTALPRAAAEALFASRTVLVFGEVNTALARSVTAQLVALSSQSAEPIRVIVNLAGRPRGIGRHDPRRHQGHRPRGDHESAPAGWRAQARLIYVAAKKEKRFALPNTRFLLHQPLGGAGGPQSDIEIEGHADPAHA